MRLLRALSLAASLALAAVQSFGAAATVHFTKSADYSPGTNGVNSVVAADVNGDGFPDMIMATNNGVSVLLNNGDGTFGSPTLYPTNGTFSNSLALADVNGDGILDIVVTNMCLDPTTCSGVSVLQGVGDGTFLAAVGYDSGGLETGAVAVGDVNNDGAPDLILTSNCQPHTCAGGSLSLLLNKGDGTFGKPFELLVTKGGPVAVGDVNHDGNLDLVTGGGVLLGHGDGTFTALGPDVPAGAVSIAVADLNHDGNLDVVVVDATGVAVQLGNGDGTFQPATNYHTGGATPLSVVIADFNGDGKPDLAVANECTQIIKGVCFSLPRVGVLAGNGDGTFMAPVSFASGYTLSVSVAAADVNGDTKTDLMVANACSDLACSDGIVRVLLNDYLAPTHIKLTSSQNPAVLNQSVTFTATLSSVIPIPDGSTVSFSDGGTPLGTPTTVGGVASVMSSFTLARSHVITASYAGDLYHSPTSVTLGEVVIKYPSTTLVNSNPNPSTSGQAVMLTATVSSGEAGGPTGVVTFFNGTTVLANAKVIGGVATFTTTKLPSGVLTINATYHGDTQTSPSSGSTSQTVN